MKNELIYLYLYVSPSSAKRRQRFSHRNANSLSCYHSNIDKKRNTTESVFLFIVITSKATKSFTTPKKNLKLLLVNNVLHTKGFAKEQSELSSTEETKTSIMILEELQQQQQTNKQTKIKKEAKSQSA